MTFKLTAAIILVAWVFVVGHIAAAKQAAPADAKTTWSGVYSEEQAKRGHEAYTKNCTECHLEDLAGDGFAPALKGPEFMNNWNDLSVGDLFERIRVSMPPANPNAVSAQTKADIVAYLLKASAFPAGTSELATQTELLKAIKFVATKPGI